MLCGLKSVLVSNEADKDRVLLHEASEVVSFID